MYLEYLNLLDNYIVNRHYYKRYKKLVSYYHDNPPKNGIVEKHHILPRKLFPEHIKSSWNIIKMPAKAHFIAHYLLAKFTDDKSMWFAFNQMRRVGRNSILYEYAREKISEIISDANSGREKTEKEKEHFRNLFKNTVVVRDSNGNIFRVSCDDERYKSGELVFYRTGYKHKKDTIEKMKENNGIRGKVLYENIYTGERRYFEVGKQTSEYIRYEYRMEYRDSVGDRTRNKNWYHDPITKESKRFSVDDQIPFGWMIGRGRDTNEGFQFVKEKMVKTIDLLEKKVSVIMKEDFDPNRYVDYQGKNTKNSLVYLFDNCIFTKKSLILKAMEEKYGYADPKCLNHNWVCKPFNSSSKRLIRAKKFKDKYKDWTLNEFGVTIVKLEDFDSELLKTYEIRSDIRDKICSS